MLRLQKYCKDKKLNVIREFTFDESAYKRAREEFNKIIEMLKTSKYRLVLCYEKIDRLTRNLKDGAVISDWVNGNDERQVHFVKENEKIGNLLAEGFNNLRIIKK